ncbi:MAG TPA: bifunctional homocysteine S-methyltransferase/methylenetetrahydrofolate reductase [Anaerolineae bacterium]|nr:bifunctional homocysteine S-methyltransferase/methylenetetrahydrofolate reductase [Anaerolineae bacterium]
MTLTRKEFQTKLATQSLLLDGAMGTVLHTKGAAGDKCLDALNLRDAALVAEVHRAYIAAGSDIIETNTFGANRYRLAAYGLGDQVSQINAAAVNIARKVIDSSFKPVLLAGSVGPLGVSLAPLGRVTKQEAEAAFQEQIAALLQAGVDLLMIETMPDYAMVKAAVTVARQINADVPIITMMTFTRDDRTLLGLNSADIARRMIKLSVDAIGINCSTGPSQVLRLAATMRAVAPEIPIAAMPNAGYPERQASGRVGYPATPNYFAEYAHAFIAANINLIGGCCGTTDTHIAAMRHALDNPQPSTITQPRIELIREQDRVSVAAEPPTKLKQALQAGTFIATVEMRPPKGVSAKKMLASAEMLTASGATFLDIADVPLARMRMGAWAAAYIIQKKLAVETILHFPIRGRNLLRIQADLLAAHALGVRNLFVTMGDPARIGDYPDALDHHDIVTTGLIKLLKEQMNAGLDKTGARLDQPTHFTVGTATSLTPSSPRKEARLLNKKIRFGADFALTQPCFDAKQAREQLELYRREFGKCELPLIVGIQPLFNGRNAEFLHNEVPGIIIPERYRQRMHAAHQPQVEGVKIAQEIIQEIRDVVQGVYIVPAFGRYDLVADVLEIL